MRRACAAGLGIALAGLGIVGGRVLEAQAEPARTIYVSPTGNDSQNGESPTTALASIQKAIERAQPGDTVQLQPGRYNQDIATVRDGRPGAPVVLRGPRDAVLAGAGGARVVQVFHDNVRVTGFTIDGAANNGSFRDKLIYVIGRDVREGVTGFELSNMAIQNAGGECVRLRYFSHDNVIAYNTIRNCGRVDFPNGAWGGKGKNGEGIYIGTAPDQWADGKNPTADPDASNRNWVHHNTFDTRGNECVDIKEGATANLIEQNTCTGQLDPESAGFDSRGDANIFRNNDSSGNVGAGVRLGGHTVGGVTYGKANQVTGNRLTNNKAGAVKVQVGPQTAICGNSLAGNNGEAVGSAASGVKPAAPCDLAPATTAPPTTAAPTTTTAPPATTTSTAPPATTTTAPPATTTTAPPATTTTSTTTAPATTAPTTTVAAPTTAPPTCATLFNVGGPGARFEAETAGRSGRFVAVTDLARSGGRAMTVPGRGMRNDAGSALRAVIDIPSAGTYQFWVQGSGPTGASDSVWVSVDGAKAVAVDLNSGWDWRKATAGKLAAGRHTIVVSNREDGASIDQIAFGLDSKANPANLARVAPTGCA